MVIREFMEILWWGCWSLPGTLGCTWLVLWVLHWVPTTLGCFWRLYLHLFLPPSASVNSLSPKYKHKTKRNTEIHNYKDHTTLRRMLIIILNLIGTDCYFLTAYLIIQMQMRLYYCFVQVRDWDRCLGFSGWITEIFLFWKTEDREWRKIFVNVVQAQFFFF